MDRMVKHLLDLSKNYWLLLVCSKSNDINLLNHRKLLCDLIAQNSRVLSFLQRR